MIELLKCEIFTRGRSHMHTKDKTIKEAWAKLKKWKLTLKLKGAQHDDHHVRKRNITQLVVWYHDMAYY